MDKREEKFPEDVMNITRRDLGGIELKDIKLVSELEAGEKYEFLKYCNMMYKSPWWKVILKEHIEAQKQFTTMEAQNYLEVLFGRATVNAFSLIDEFLANHSKMLSETKEPEMTEEEKHDVLPKSG